MVFEKNETWFVVVGVIIMFSTRGFVGLLLSLTASKLCCDM